jgi:hypothetical protein
MAKTEIKKDKALSPKKEIRHRVAEQLKHALTSLEEKLGKKEFENRIKKASKLLTAGIKLKPVKKTKDTPVKNAEPASAGEKG